MSCEYCNSLRNEIFILKKKIEKLENLLKVVNPPKEKCNTFFDENIRCASCNRVICGRCCERTTMISRLCFGANINL